MVLFLLYKNEASLEYCKSIIFGMKFALSFYYVGLVERELIIIIFDICCFFFNECFPQHCSSGSVLFCAEMQALSFMFRFLKEIFLCSWVTVAEVEDFIKERVALYRLQGQKDHQCRLFSRPAAYDWAEAKEFTKETLTRLITGLKPREDPTGIGRDCSLMGIFIRQVSQGMIPTPKDLELKDFLPTQAPLLDYLKLDAQRPDSWSLPTVEYLSYLQANRGISMGILGNIEVREIVLGSSSPADIQEISDWMWSKFAEDQLIYPTGVMSMDVEEVKITLYDYLRLAGQLDPDLDVIVCSKVRATTVNKQLKGTKDEWFQFPARLMLGNGITWSLQILYPVREHYHDGKRSKVIKKIKILPEVLDLLRSLPVLTGVGIRTDIVEIEDVYSMLSGQEVILPKFVELGPLALCAGWGSDRTNMPILAASVIGMIMNKMVSEGDTSWGYYWQDIPDALQIYCIADLRMGHITYLILMAILQRDIFPDRDTVILLGNVDDKVFTEWFSALIRTALLGTETYQPSLEKARSRAELLQSLRFRTQEGKISSRCPSRVSAIIPLLPNWPTITYGGPRFLHQVRIATLSNFQHLREHQNAMDEAFFQVQWSKGDLQLVTFGLDCLNGVDWTVPAQTPGFGLEFCFEIPSQPLKICPATMDPTYTQVQSTYLKRPQRFAVLEWIRLNPTMFGDLVERMEVDAAMMGRLGSYYESMRLEFFRTTGSTDVVSYTKEEQIRANNQKLLERVRKDVEDCEVELQMRKARLMEVEFEMSQGLLVNRTGWEHFLTATTKRPIKYIPRSRPRYVVEPPRTRQYDSEQAGPSSGQRRSGSSVTSKGRKRSRDCSEHGEPEKRGRSSTPFSTSRSRGDPELVFDPSEHRSCGKYTGKRKSKVQAQAITQDEWEERSRKPSQSPSVDEYHILTVEYDDSILDDSD